MGLRLLVVEGNTPQARELHENVSGRTPGRYYADTLRRLAPDAACDICYPTDDDAKLPAGAALEDYDGVVLTGSSLNIYSGGREVTRQIELARAIYAAGVPFLGSCWGLQVAATAAGGHVAKNPLGSETGIARNISLTEAGRSHPLLAGRPGAFDAPCSHDDIVAVPPPDSTILATNAMAPVQAAEIRHDGGTFWGFQYHPEYTLSEIAAILERRAPHLIEIGYFADEAENRAYCADLRQLEADPDRRDIAWRLGIQREIIDRDICLTEIRNWLDHRVRPHTSQRGRA